MENLIGQYIGRYHILEQIGEGGMAVVYKAFDTRLERDVAIKIIRKGAFPPEKLAQIMKRFEREAKALAHLSHPNIVKVHDYGEFEGSPYLVMEYLPGGTLKQIVEASAHMPLPYREAARLLIPVAHALGYAHQQGILHRDVKPSNIMITATGDPTLTDFGIAKILESEETQGLTITGGVVGTAEYMSPEQGLGEPVDQRADIYSLGITFYQLVTGRVPFTATTPYGVVNKQIHEPMPDPRLYVPNLPEKVIRVLLQALAKQPSDRYANMGEFANAMEILAATPGELPKPQPEAAKTLEALRLPGKGIALQSEQQRKKRSWLPWVIIPGVLVLITCGYIAVADLPKLLGMFAPQPTSTSAPTSAPQPTFTFTSLPSETPPPSALPPTERPTKKPAPTKSSKDGMVLIYVPAGDFTMGDTVEHAMSECQRVSNLCEPVKNITFTDEAPPHKVYLDAFLIDQTEVSNAMYAKCVQAGACNSNGAGTDNYPVVNITWKEAANYCAWAGRRLLTEAEWEKAARGTDQRTFPWGNEPPSCEKTNYAGSGCGGNPAEVGSHPGDVSFYGVLDMAGNVSEWVADWFEHGGYPSNTQNNPQGPGPTNLKARRGGSFINDAGLLRATVRGYYNPNLKFHSIGFRCALNP